MTALALLLCSATSWAQDGKISLDQAIQFAKERNGAVKAAAFDVKAAESRLAQSFSNFLPSITPSYRYDTQRFETTVGGSSTVTRTDEGRSQVNANWLLLDSGQRDLNFRASKRGLEQQRSDTLQTLRETLFAVYQQYFNALRAQELFRVQEASVQRAQEILKMTDLQIEVGAAPKKDRLQANADFLNAKVGRLSAQNQVTTSHATLKAAIGWTTTDGDLQLQSMPEPADFEPYGDLQDVIKDGLAQREDLRSRRLGLEAQRLNVQRVRLAAGVTWSLDANYSRLFTQNEADNRNLSFLVSIPLYDGSRSREAAREAELGLASANELYKQSERTAIAEIESAFLELGQNRERFLAAKLALEAAQLNYKAASESQERGAEGTSVITSLTAKISLVTAESNFVEAVFDTYISEIRFRLVTGRPLPNET